MSMSRNFKENLVKYFKVNVKWNLTFSREDWICWRGVAPWFWFPKRFRALLDFPLSFFKKRWKARMQVSVILMRSEARTIWPDSSPSISLLSEAECIKTTYFDIKSTQRKATVVANFISKTCLVWKIWMRRIGKNEKSKASIVYQHEHYLLRLEPEVILENISWCDHRLLA